MQFIIKLSTGVQVFRHPVIQPTDESTTTSQDSNSTLTKKPNVNRSPHQDRMGLLSANTPLALEQLARQTRDALIGARRSDGGDEGDGEEDGAVNYEVTTLQLN